MGERKAHRIAEGYVGVRKFIYAHVQVKIAEVFKHAEKAAFNKAVLNSAFAHIENVKLRYGNLAAQGGYIHALRKLGAIVSICADSGGNLAFVKRNGPLRAENVKPRGNGAVVGRNYIAAAFCFKRHRARRISMILHHGNINRSFREEGQHAVYHAACVERVPFGIKIEHGIYVSLRRNFEYIAAQRCRAAVRRAVIGLCGKYWTLHFFLLIFCSRALSIPGRSPANNRA